jgi:hypothetical protein
MPDRNYLKKIFLETFDKDFEILDDELQEMPVSQGGGRYWLVRVRPKSVGFFVVRYNYREKDSVSPYGEREIHIKVGKPGCRRNSWRWHPYANLCLGDAVILPISLHNYTNFTFSRFTKVERLKNRLAEEEAEVSKPPDDTSSLNLQTVENPAAAFLKYVGRGFREAVHRDLRGVSVGFDAMFEAQRPGRFNLRLTGRAPEGLREYLMKDAWEGNYHIIVVPGGAPLTLLAPNENISSYDSPDSKEPRSGSSQTYQTSIIFLQPGDRVKLGYLGKGLRRDTEEYRRMKESFKEVEPVIQLLPFSVKDAERYNDWIISYLPS